MNKVFISQLSLEALVYSGLSQAKIAVSLKCSKFIVVRKMKQYGLCLHHLPPVALACRYLNRHGETVTISCDKYFIGGHAMSARELISYANELKAAGKEDFR